LTPPEIVDISGHMDKSSAVRALSALAQSSRLDAFRHLVRAGTDGLPAGDIARALGVPHNTMSAHLAILVNAGLAGSRRSGRSVVYTVRVEAVRDLLGFLMQDCCRGKPEVCEAALARVLPECCAEERP
jgi:DNA-binding transcriptional ArsR family regulator